MNLSNPILCNKITITQGVTQGFLGGPYDTMFNISDEITVSILQCGVRIIELSTTTDIPCDELFWKFQPLEKLLMLLDGRFYEIKNIEFSGGNNTPEQISKIKEKILNGRLSYFSSNNFSQNNLFKLLPFQSVLNQNIYNTWISLLEQMDIMHQVFLYSLSNNKNPVDMNFAFLIEIAEPLVELIQEKTCFCQTLSPGERGTTLKMCIDAIITLFGKDIFDKELKANYKDFLDKVVKSRVRVMHIKKNQHNYFDGKECIRYSMKFSLLYRKILFDLLEISYDIYKDKLHNVIHEIDKW